MSKQEYVVGFVMDSLERTLLIEKIKPAWQKGKLNGVGGKIEPGETKEYAMRREFREEAGMDIAEGKWVYCVCLVGIDYIVHFFTAQTEFMGEYAQLTDEKLFPVFMWMLPSETIYNLRWIIPLTRDTFLAKPQVVVDAALAAQRDAQLANRTPTLLDRYANRKDFS